jgi:hypothetical protein
VGKEGIDIASIVNITFGSNGVEESSFPGSATYQNIGFYDKK